MTRTIRVAVATSLAAAIAACGGGGGDGGSTGGGKTTPTLKLSTTTVTFTATQAGAALPGAQTIAVTNSGGGTLAMPTVAVTYGSGAGWLVSSVAADGAGWTITVRPSTTALAPATYTATLEVASAGATGSPASVSVSWEVTANPNPVLAADPATLAFVGQTGQPDPATQDIQVSNVGGGTLDPITVGTSEAWLSASVSGNVVTVGASVGSLTDGSYLGTVTIASANADNTPLSVPVTLTVNQPTLQATPASLSFATNVGVSPAAKTFTVTNAGSGTLVAPVAAASETWLDATVSGSDPTYTVSVSVDASALIEATYAATITLTSAGASNSPLTVPVEVVVAQPVLDVSPATLSFTTNVGVNPPAQTLTLSNIGGGTMATPTVGDDAAWLSPGAVSGAGPFTVQINVDVAGLAAGTYDAVVTVTSAGATDSPATVPVSLTVEQPTIEVFPTSLVFSMVEGTNPAPKTLTITNSGTGTLAPPSVTDDAGWLSATVGGSDPTYVVTVTVNAAALAVGPYGATLTITSPGASSSPTVSVTLTVASDGGIDTSTIARAYETIGALWNQKFAECFEMSPIFVAQMNAEIGEIAAALAAARAAGRIDYGVAEAQACGAALAVATCAELEVEDIPECEGVLAGQVQNGDPCYASDECAAGYCTGDVTGTCPASCAAFKALGDPCISGEECGVNECLPSGEASACGVPAPPGAQGQACSYESWPPCETGLYCKFDVTASCEPREALGATCLSDSDCQVELGCDWNASGTCKARVGTGASCADAVCGYGLFCSVAAGTTCAEYPVIGEACDEAGSCRIGFCNTVSLVCVAGTVAVGELCDYDTLFCVEDAYCDPLASMCVAMQAPSACYWP
jgi:hypothetical protein